MAIAPTCCRCHGELQEPGGLLFSPPIGDGWTVKKDHLCVGCYRTVIELIGCEPAL